MKKILIVLAMIAGTFALGVSPASAHTGDLKASYVCQADGTYLVTYTLNITQTGLKGSTMWDIGTPSFKGTPGSASGLNRGPVASNGAQTITLGTEVYPGNATVGNWVYAYTTWTDNFKKGSDGRVDKFPGDCKPPKPGDKVVTNPDTEEAADCDTKTVRIHHSETTTTYTWNGTKYVGTSTTKKLPDTTRAATEQECPPPEEPEAIPVSTTEVDVTCELYRSRDTVTTPTYTYDEESNTWVKGDDDVVTSDWTETPVTDAQLEEAGITDCEVVEPPAGVDECPDVEGDQPEGTDCGEDVSPPGDENPPAVTPPVDNPRAAVPVTARTPAANAPVAASAGVLPNTGGTNMAALLAGLAFMFMGAFAFMCGSRVRKN